VEAAESDVAVYGDLFRRDHQGDYDPQFNITELLAKASGVFAAHDHEVDLDELVKLLSDQHLHRLLAQASAYLDQEEIRHAAQARLEEVIGADTEVVIAHSLGTIVADETLSRHPEWEVNGLVTMGSPLGGEMVVGPHDPAPNDDRAVFPVGVDRWVNRRNIHDPDCIRPLTDVFDGTITERLVDNRHRMHDPERYLNNSTTGGAIAGMLSV
jgi:hypothetical protein